MIRLILQTDGSPVWIAVAHLLIVQDHPKGTVLVLAGDVRVYVTEPVEEIISMLYEATETVHEDTTPVENFSNERGKELSAGEQERKSVRAEQKAMRKLDNEEGSKQ